MKLKKHLPLIVTPYSETIVGGISSWAKNMMVYAEMDGHHDAFQIHYYANYLMAVTNTKISARVTTGIIVYSKLVYQTFVLILKYKPSVVHIVSSATLGLIKDTILVSLAKLTKTPTIIHWHFGRIPELAKANNWEWKLLKYVVRNCSISMVIDNKSYEALLEQGFLNVVNVPNPIPPDIEQRAKAQLEQYSKPGLNRVLFVGHLLREKGVFELVEACIKIPEIDELVIIGPFEEDIKNELITFAQQRDNGRWLKLLGQQNKDQVLKYMRESLILTLPSYTEGFPNVVIEAMAMGCPVIATDVGAIPDMIDFGSDKPCGICVPARNVEKLNEAILNLINDPEKAIEMGRMGIKKVLSHYTLEQVVGQYEHVWSNLNHNRQFETS